MENAALGLNKSLTDCFRNEKNSSVWVLDSSQDKEGRAVGGVGLVWGQTGWGHLPAALGS